jgi:hypothetical protein
LLGYFLALIFACLWVKTLYSFKLLIKHIIIPTPSQAVVSYTHTRFAVGEVIREAQGYLTESEEQQKQRAVDGVFLLFKDLEDSSEEEIALTQEQSRKIVNDLWDFDFDIPGKLRVLFSR